MPFKLPDTALPSSLVAANRPFRLPYRVMTKAVPAGRLPATTDYAPASNLDLSTSQNADPALPSCNPEISQQFDANQLSHFSQGASKRGGIPVLVCCLICQLTAICAEGS